MSASTFSTLAKNLAKQVKSDLIGRKRSFKENDSFSGVIRLIAKHGEGSHTWHPHFVQFVSAIRTSRVSGVVDMVVTRWYSAEEIVKLFAELVALGCQSQDEFARALNAKNEFFEVEYERLKMNPFRR